jgi:hypothetical protein
MGKRKSRENKRNPLPQVATGCRDPKMVRGVSGSSPEELAFTTSKVSTVSSDPTTGDRWFAPTLNASFPFATSFIGDYSNIAALRSGGVAAYWTDLREQACFGSRCGHGEDAFFATVP